MTPALNPTIKAMLAALGSDRTFVRGAGTRLFDHAGRDRRAPLPSRYDILSRGMTARFDCADAKRDLGWSPVSDPAVFARLAVEVHGG